MIEISNLQKVAGDRLALDVEALAVPPGEIAAVVGRVDSGTQALFDLLTGRVRPTAGTVRLAGHDPFAERDAFSQQVGVLFADNNLYARQSTLGNLKFYCRLRRLPRARATEVLEQVGLRDHADVRAEKLPPGLARRLAFGRAILHAPRVLLLMEPFAGCDESSISLLAAQMRAFASGGGTCLILAEEPSYLTNLCETIYQLDQGRIASAYRPGDEQPPALPFMIPVRLEASVALVNPIDILYVEARDNRTLLHTAQGSLPAHFTLAELEQRLSRSGFFRAHRSYLVNLQHVKEVVVYTRNSYALLLKDEGGTQVPLSKSAERDLRELLGY
ncbi:MAG: LytTR family transcriptional regulator DNA-binding domain-containing protein [Anaerolineae bacterium]|nr:LytTR family transcriptional regulator DNA-binding domain-containing protein [Anaerolineae bacterium]